MSERMGEKKMWAACLMQHINDAIFPFRFPPNESMAADTKNHVRQQLATIVQKLKDKKRLPEINTNKQYEMSKSLYFLETDQLDRVAEYLGYDTLFINRTFEFVQWCVTMRKGIYTLEMMIRPPLLKANTPKGRAELIMRANEIPLGIWGPDEAFVLETRFNFIKRFAEKAA